MDDLYENNPSGDLLRGIDLGKVANAVKAHRKALEPFRDNRVEFVRQHVGKYYGLGGTGYEVPLPLISTFLSVHSRALIAKEPRVCLSTFSERFAPAVDAMQSYLNDYFEETELADTLRRAVYDGLISEAHLKVALSMPEIAESGYKTKAGQPFVCLVDEDDWVCDMRARTEKEVTYVGHRYRVPLEVAQEILDKKLVASEPRDYDENGNPRIFTLSSGLSGNEDEIEDHVDLWEIHLKRKNIVLTIRDHNGLPGGDKKDILRVRKYIGPRCGSIISLGFGTAPGNLRPLSPVMGLLPLHLAANRSYRKLIKTADNFKVLNLMRGSLMGTDGKTIKDAKHMDFAAVDDPTASGERAFNTPNPALQLFVQDLRSAFDYVGGGLATLGGRQAMSGTATQEKILNANSQAGLSDMQGTTVSFVSRAVKVMAWYLWNHPENVYETQKKFGTRESDVIRRQLLPNDEAYENAYSLPGQDEFEQASRLMREGPLPRIKIDPYSLSHTTPEEKRQLFSMLRAEYAPYAAILAQQGVIFDVMESLKLDAKYADEPDILKIFKAQGPPEPTEPGGEESQGGLNKEISAKPANTERTYNRISSGGGARDQGAQAQSQLMKMASSPGMNGSM